MKKFEFRLQRVLDVKNTLEEVRRRDFLTAKGEHDKHVRGLNELYGKIDFYRNELNELDRGTVSTQVLNMYYAYFNSLSWRIEYQKKQIKLAMKEMEKRRLRLTEAVKERKILEQLKDKQYAGYLKEFGLDEQKHSDEISSIKFFKDRLEFELEAGIAHE